MTPTHDLDKSDAVKESATPLKSHRSVWWALLIAAVVLGSAIYLSVRARVASAANLASATEQGAIPLVNAVHPKRGAATSEIVLPGGAQAFVDAPIYARTNGYLKHWYFDIGARVKQGQLLAEIETPEVDQQLVQARADLETAKANLNLAVITADRWLALWKSDSVSKQETDQAVSNMHAQQATVDSNRANVHRLEELQSFEKVYAPFDGIVTARNTDIGALINAGAATTPGKELFHMTAIHTLRVFVSVPEVYLRAAIPGASATLTLDEYAGQTFRGTLARNANAIDPIARTLLVEVDVNNPDGRLLPGAYMTVHLKLPEQNRSVTIPANTILFRSEGLTVGVVRNNHVALVPVKIGRDYGDTVEILSGLQAADLIIVNPSDSLINGAEVRVLGAQG
jgi:RND family efflux transporter MFP subunit